MKKFNTLQETPLYNFIMDNFPWSKYSDEKQVEIKAIMTESLLGKFMDVKNSWLYDEAPTEYYDNDFNFPNSSGVSHISGAFVFGQADCFFWYEIADQIADNLKNNVSSSST